MDVTREDPPGAALRPAGAKADTAFFGHPRGLSTLFFSEMWERFSYYGMRAFLMLFMVAPTSDGGLGFTVAKAGIVYGIYTSMVYLLGVPGGWIADKFVGLRKAVLYGGVLIMFGHIALAIPATPTFYLGLGLVMLGTGLLKPNISAMVGQLYQQGDPRRDSGFSLYYMGINLGAFFAPLACGYLAQDAGFRDFLDGIGIPASSAWHFGFGAAAVGMALGLVQYVAGWRHLGDAGVHPSKPATPAEEKKNKVILAAIVSALVVVPGVVVAMALSGAVEITPERLGTGFEIFLFILAFGLWTGIFASSGWTKDERKRLVVILLLFFGAIVFWAVFEQAGSTFNLFADRSTKNEIFGWSFPASWFQSVNAILVITMASVFAFVWLWLGRKGRDPSSPAKFGVAMVLLAAGILLMVPAARLAADGSRVSPLWLVGLYLLHTCGELCLSPVGLSSMTKLAPARITGMVMGIWFLGASIGNYVAGRVSGMYESVALDKIFIYLSLAPIVAAVIFFALVKPIGRMLARAD